MEGRQFNLKRNARIGAGILIALVIGGIVWLGIGVEKVEPSHQGKSLRAWLKGFEASHGSAEYAAAEAAIRQMGTNVLPFLIRDLQRPDPPFYRRWVGLRAKLNLGGGADYAMFRRRRAGQACGALGEAGEAAFQAMAQAMNDPGAAADVANGLSRMMPRSVPVLTHVLATGNARARSRAADNLVTAFSHREAEPVARAALIHALLHDSDRGVRMAAASALTYWNTELDVVVAALTQALSDPNSSVRGNAASSLGNLGVAAKTAVPELLKLMQDTNSYVSETVGSRAAAMLLRIDSEAAAGKMAR